MPKSIAFSEDERHHNDDSHGNSSNRTSRPDSRSPIATRSPEQSMSSSELRARLQGALTMTPTETTGLLKAPHEPSTSYTRDMGTGTYTPRSVPGFSRTHSMANSMHGYRHHSRRPSWNPGSEWRRSSGLRTPKLHQPMGQSLELQERVWYDQFTSTDWVHDSIQDGHRLLELRRKGGFRGRLAVWADSAQGWILVLLIGCLTALAAYMVDITETAIFDLKRGVCMTGWYRGRVSCCQGQRDCAAWQTWSEIIRPSGLDSVWVDFILFNLGCVLLAGISCFLTLYSRTVVPSHIASTFDENLGAVKNIRDTDNNEQAAAALESLPANIYFSAAGSGVAEVKVILSGFVLHGYLGLRTLVIKLIALIFSVASGMSLGKEGPYVHVATCIGNVACRLFSKYHLNDGKRREVLSASAASGVAVAFGSPLGGVLFSLEEVSYYFPPKTLFRTFFCCIAAALSLKFLNPYGTGKIVLFEVPYASDWRFFEIFCFAVLGAAGGILGALFIKASRFWATTFRRIRIIKEYPMVEVLLVALVTGLTSFWNRYTRLPVAELLFELAAPCDGGAAFPGLCPSKDGIPAVIGYLCIAFVVKAFLTTITFGIKVPAGIYVPSMVVGGLMGRIMGHTIQYVVVNNPGFFLWSECPADGGPESCITPGVYAMVAAGATMCGVTRLSVTLAVILFELTGSLDHVLPFSLAVLFAKWAADAVEPLSIYDLLTDMNSYPFLDNKVSPVFDTNLGDIVTRTTLDRIIDITISPFVKASSLRAKLTRLQNAGELDGGLPIIRNKMLVGLIPAPDLEFALDQIEDEDADPMCRMVSSDDPHNRSMWAGLDVSDDEDDENQSLLQAQDEAMDLTPYVDYAPVALDVKSPMDLVYQCFVKLGLRYMCATEDGEYRGMVHKKVFVRYCKTEGVVDKK